MKSYLFIGIALFLLLSCSQSKQKVADTKDQLSLKVSDEQLDIYLGDQLQVTQVAKTAHRPYLHPIMAPDGNGELTQYSPGHHKHQTGLYWGFTRVNGAVADPDSLLRFFYSREKTPEQQALVGRDFFHHPEGEYWRRKGLKVLKESGDQLSWETQYEMLDEKGEPMIIETQSWTFSQEGDKNRLDLEWKAEALRDIRIGAFDYGGMFLRMPWHKDIKGAAVNSAGQQNQKAEGQNAKWVDVGMSIEGREDWGHIAILDHPENANHPTPWRVDGQLGVGPCRAIEGDWSIAQGKTERMKFSLLVYTGDIATEELNSMMEGMAK
ncbi:MAG: PmoA family protein [Bacteroidota bacterium]